MGWKANNATGKPSPEEALVAPTVLDLLRAISAAKEPPHIEDLISAYGEFAQTALAEKLIEDDGDVFDFPRARLTRRGRRYLAAGRPN